MDAAIARLIDFLSAHREWAFWVALVFSIAENTAFLSILIPSTAILVAVGALVATGSVDFLPIFAGRGGRGGDRLHLLAGGWGCATATGCCRSGRCAIIPIWCSAARTPFAKWGPVAIIIGHFFGPLRPVVFLMCGMALMPFWWFQLFNVSGSIAWAYRRAEVRRGRRAGHRLCLAPDHRRLTASSPSNP